MPAKERGERLIGRFDLLAARKRLSSRPMRGLTPRHRAARQFLGPLAVWALLASGCTSEADRAAKARIFSPEDPSPDLLKAAERLDVAQAASDPALWTRLLQMDRLESTRRLGAHEAKSRVKFRWTLDKEVVELAEGYTFLTDASGHFTTTITNDQDAGLEFVWTDGRAFARSRYGPFRERRIDRAQHDAWRDRATGSLREVFDLYDGRLKAVSKGKGEHRGRAALRFAFVIEDRSGQGPVVDNAPPRLFPKVLGASGELVTGPDDDTARRIAFAQHRVPQAASGHVLIDEQTGVVLDAHLEGVFMVPDQSTDAQPGPAARLTVSVDFEVTPKKDVKISPPENIASTAIPHGLLDPLGFLGDAAPRPAAAEPADEDE